MPSNLTPNCTCERCGTAFHVKPSKAATARWCSNECRKSRVQLICEWCSREFEIFTSRKHQRYCSPECRCKAKTGTLEERYQAAVNVLDDPDECWERVGKGDSNGYGVIKFQEKTVKLHRLSYELYKGPIPSGLMVRHTCDNPKCSNPRHLILGTNVQNIADRHSRGRSAKGATSGMAKLSEADVREIHGLIGHVSQSEIALRFGVSTHAIHSIQTGKTWRHLTHLPVERLEQG